MHRGILAVVASLLVAAPAADAKPQVKAFKLADDAQAFGVIQGPDGAEYATGGIRGDDGFQLCLYKLAGTGPVTPFQCTEDYTIPQGVSTNLAVAAGAIWAVGDRGGVDTAVIDLPLDGAEPTAYAIDSNEVGSAALFASAEDRLRYVGGSLHEIDAAGADQKLLGGHRLGETRFGTELADGTIWLQTLTGFLKIAPDLTVTETPITGFCTLRQATEGRCFPQQLQPGPGGALWFVDGGTFNRVGRLSTAGDVEKVDIPNPGGRGEIGIATLGNKLWVAKGGKRLVHVSANGKVGTVKLPPSLARLKTSALAAGKGGTLWLASKHQVVRVKP